MNATTPIAERNVAPVSRFLHGVKRIVLWPARVIAARRCFAQLAQMSDYELQDIGLTRQDLWNAASLPLDEDPTRSLAKAVRSRRLRC